MFTMVSPDRLEAFRSRVNDACASVNARSEEWLNEQSVMGALQRERATLFIDGPDLIILEPVFPEDREPIVHLVLAHSYTNNAFIERHLPEVRALASSIGATAVRMYSARTGLLRRHPEVKPCKTRLYEIEVTPHG